MTRDLRSIPGGAPDAPWKDVEAVVADHVEQHAAALRAAVDARHSGQVGVHAADLRAACDELLRLVGGHG